MFLIVYLVGVGAGILCTSFTYMKRPKQKKGRHQFEERYEKYVPLADSDITDKTRRDHSIKDFK